jgi:hypothetical protein
MSLKDRYYDLLDWWDRFIANPRKTHIAAAVCGAIIAETLRVSLHL